MTSLHHGWKVHPDGEFASEGNSPPMGFGREPSPWEGVRSRVEQSACVRRLGRPEDLGAGTGPPRFSRSPSPRFG